MDSNGMIIEKTNNFETCVCGYITDICHKVRDLLADKDSLNSVEIFFENKVLLIKDDVANGVNISMIVDCKDL